MEATQRYSTRGAARILQSTEGEVRRWARLGGVAPETGPGGRLEFTFQQLLLLRTTRGLLEAGIPARRVRLIWTSLRRQLSDDLPLTSIRILASGDRAVAWDGTTSWQPDSGQFLLDFDVGEIVHHAEMEPADAEAASLDAREMEPAEVAGGEALPVGQGAIVDIAAATRRDSMRARREATPLRTAVVESQALSAEQWFHLGCELESHSPVEAHQAYLQAIEANPDFCDAHLNLGRLLHEEKKLGEAEFHYREAVRCSPDEATSHFNLAVLLEDRGRPNEAILAYQRAITLDDSAADAHYNLGLLLEKSHRNADAMKHLMIARRLYALSGQGN